MFQITEFKSVKKKYLIIIEGENSEKEYIVSDDLVVEFRLLKGKKLDKAEYLNFKEAYQRDFIYQKVLYYALYKPRCTYEIKKYLDKKDIFQKNQNYYLKRLLKLKIVDDKKYTIDYIDEAFNFKKAGPRQIISNLKLKRIDESFYLPIINRITDKQLEHNIKYLYKKKLNLMKNKSLNKAMQDIKQFIIKKGYNYEIVNRVIENLKDEIADNFSESDALKKDLLIARKKYNKDSRDNHQKILAYLFRKGYTYSKIKETIGELNE